MDKDCKDKNSKCSKNYDCKRPDYIIIGGGASGCVAAEVLSRDRKTSVLVLEAGTNEDHNPEIVAPIQSVSPTTQGPFFFWQGTTLPDASAADQIFQWTNGRLLGGGTSIFGMTYTRGSKQRFDEWSAYVGPTWNGKVVYDEYKMMEKFNGIVSDPQNHGYHGRMNVRVGISDSTALPQYIEAFLSTNAPGSTLIDDYNSPDTPIGYFANWQYYQFPDQTRGSSSRDYLTSEDKKNPSTNPPGNKPVIDLDGNGLDGRILKVETQTTATHIVWSKKKKGVIKGIWALRKGVPVLYKANKDYLLASGFNSSYFLQVNGIGPRSSLEKAGIPVNIDLPGVGRNLRNAPYIIAAFLAAPPGITVNSQPGSFQVWGAFLPDPRPGSDPTKRKIQLNGAISNDLFPGVTTAMLLFQPLRPLSVGNINPQDADPLKIAAVNMGILSSQEDLDFDVAVFNLILIPMINYMVNNLGYSLLFPTADTFASDAAIAAYIQSNVGNTHHYQCFNAMGPKENGGVVDVWGRVHGTQNLRIIDDSIPPITTDGNTGGTAMMLAHRISRHLLGEI